MTDTIPAASLSVSIQAEQIAVSGLNMPPTPVT
jgi:hypothetical protein